VKRNLKFVFLWILLWWPWLLEFGKEWPIKKNQSCTDKQGKGLSVNPFSAIEMYIQHMMSFILLSGWVGSTVKYKRALILSLQSLMLIWSSSWSWGCHGLFSDQVDYRKASSHMKVVYIRRGVLYHWAFLSQLIFMLRISYSTKQPLCHDWKYIIVHACCWHTKKIVIILLWKKNEAVGGSDVTCSDWSLPCPNRLSWLLFS